MQNVVGPTLVAMATTFGLGAEIPSPTGLFDWIVIMSVCQRITGKLNNDFYTASLTINGRQYKLNYIQSFAEYTLFHRLINNRKQYNQSKSTISFTFSFTLHFTFLHLDVAGSTIPLAGHIKILGVTLDKHLTFDDHVTAVCKSASYHIRAMRNASHSPCHHRRHGEVHSLCTPRLKT